MRHQAGAGAGAAQQAPHALTAGSTETVVPAMPRRTARQVLSALNKADRTQVRFWTDDVERDVRELESRGAVFEDYEVPTLKTVDHVATTPGIGKSAWFSDPDGNPLALFQPE